MTRLLALLVPLICHATSPLSAADPAADRSLAGSRPNIIFVLTDDQGFADASCHGNPVLKTPNIDRLHAEGRHFDDFRVSPTCAPTRCSLMTGRHEFHSGVTHTIFERERMSLKATTVTDLLKTAGYTNGIFGKWHLGDEDAYQPERRGFDEVFIHGGGGIGQTCPGSCGDAPGNRYFDPTILHNGVFEKTDGYCTDVFFAQALRWIDSVRGQRQPFFAYIACNAPHDPTDCPKEYEDRYAGKVPAKIASVYGMIANIDDNLGRLLAQLKTWQLEENTLVIFMNDNGPAFTAETYNAGMTGSKNSPDNGGTRAISLWRWPGRIAPSGCNKLTAHLDVLPTFVELAGAKLPEDVAAKLEGFSLTPLLADPGAAWHEDRKLVAHVGRWKPGSAPEKFGPCSVRWQQYLLLRKGEDWQLFDLHADPAQKQNLAADHPEIVASLSHYYDEWWQQTLPQLENEQSRLTAAKVNPFKVRYEKQFGQE